MQNSSVLVLFL